MEFTDFEKLKECVASECECQAEEWEEEDEEQYLADAEGKCTLGRWWRMLAANVRDTKDEVGLVDVLELAPFAPGPVYMALLQAFEAYNMP